MIKNDNDKGTCLLTGTALSEDINMIKSGAQKILKRKYLTREIRGVWNVTTKVITVTLRETGNNSENT